MEITKENNMNNDLMSQAINELATALSKAQAEMNSAVKDKNNPFFKSKYADFEAIVEASRPALSKNGLSVVQSLMFSEPDSYLVTILLHSSGQWIKSIAKHNPPKADIQSLSSYNTYLKRICYASLVGVVTCDEDDDGEEAVKPYRGGSNFTQVARTEYISSDQLEHLKNILMDHGDTARTIMDAFGIDNLSQIPKDKFLSVFKRVQEIIATKNK